MKNIVKHLILNNGDNKCKNLYQVWFDKEDK